MNLKKYGCAAFGAVCIVFTFATAQAEEGFYLRGDIGSTSEELGGESGEALVAGVGVGAYLPAGVRAEVVADFRTGYERDGVITITGAGSS